MDETFFRSPPHGLGNSPSTAGPNSSYFAKIFLRRVPCDFSEQTLVQVLCTFELLLDSATFWFLSRLLESLHVTRPTSVNRVARKRQHKSYLVATSTWSSRCVYVRTVYTVAKFHGDPLFSKWGLIFFKLYFSLLVHCDTSFHWTLVLNESNAKMEVTDF